MPRPPRRRASQPPSGRLPFDPTKAAGAAPSSLAPLASAAHLTVSQLASLIDHALREKLATGLKVVGELSRFTERTHWYFDLKDAGAVIPCVMWQSAARKVGFTPQPGQQVLLTGRVEYYQPFGKTQFIADKLEPIGAGALDLAYRKLLEELKTLGWFDAERKRPLPMFPRKVAIITSRTAAALQDVLDTVARRCPALPLALVDVRVQGEQAAPQIAAALRSLARQHEALGIDVILLTRGGGSLEDLWAFNERIVAEAIVQSPIPVVAAIGHETDTTIAELVADLRCATPTQAAMRIAPDAAALRRQLHSTGARLGASLTRHIRHDAERLRSAARHSFFSDPVHFLDEKTEDLHTRTRDLSNAMRDRIAAATRALDDAARTLNRHRPEAVYARREAALTHARARLRSALTTHLDRRTATLDSAARSLDLVGPHNVLKRGYSVTLAADGTILRSAASARPGARIRTRLADGSFGSIVTPEGADSSSAIRPMPPARLPPPRRRKPASDPDQPRLF